FRDLKVIMSDPALKLEAIHCVRTVHLDQHLSQADLLQYLLPLGNLREIIGFNPQKQQTYTLTFYLNDWDQYLAPFFRRVKPTRLKLVALTDNPDTSIYPLVDHLLRWHGAPVKITLKSIYGKIIE